MATEYVLFRRTPDGTYAPAGRATAHTPNAAARLIDQENGYGYLAVPESNAHFVELGVEPQPPKVVARKVEGPEFPIVGQTTIDDQLASPEDPEQEVVE